MVGVGAIAILLLLFIFYWLIWRSDDAPTPSNRLSRPPGREPQGSWSIVKTLNDSRKGCVYKAITRRKHGIAKLRASLDIWSLGCTVLEMTTAAFPYSNLTWFGALAEVREGKMPMMPEQLPNNCREFVEICLQINPLNRPTASQLLRHPFIACANTNGPHSHRR